MHVAVVANGDLPAGSEVAVDHILAAADWVVAADGGLVHCRAVGRWPDLLVGDMDSAPGELVTQARSEGTRIVEHPADKDATDLELALAEAAAAGATSVTVVAPFGGRLDHELATVGLLAGPAWQELTINATDGRRQLWIIRDELHLALEPGATVSLLPWGGDASGVSISGVQWPLDAARLPLGSTLGVSNVAADVDQHISVATGTLLAVADAL